MKWIEADTVPEECQACKGGICYNCDHAGKRWFLSRKDDLLMRRKMLLQAISRTQKQIEKIDRELALMEEML